MSGFTFDRTGEDRSDQICFLVASDIHAGYAENKSYGNDSFETLREVLSIGMKHKVDFVLLGGDLFHENTPSRETHLKVVRLLRRFCFREGYLDLKFVSDPTVNFQHSDFPTVNYKDPNLQVTMPIFTIHGNHDDLSGKGLTALDVLHETGLINLFGKFSTIEQIEVSPILLQKGETKVAIYGIGSQRDDRLSRAFKDEKVKFIRPDDEESWFSILVLHQNRPLRSTTRTTGAFLPPDYIPDFFDLVVWGHEHESLMDPSYHVLDSTDPSRGFFIIQPGSTIATSLSKEEAGKKYCGIMRVRGREMNLTKIELKTTRQIIIDELELDERLFPAKMAKTTVRLKDMPDEGIIRDRIEELLNEADSKKLDSQPYPPRVRLRVIYSGRWLNMPLLNSRRFGSRYAGRVANAPEMISIRYKKDEVSRKKKTIQGDILNFARTDDIKSVEELVEKYFAGCPTNDKMFVLSEGAMSLALKEYSASDNFTAADKAFLESLREQIWKRADAVKEKLEEEFDTLDGENFEEAVEKFIEREIARRGDNAEPLGIQDPDADFDSP